MVENDQQKHISVHIEKTGGTSVERFLVDFYGRNRVLIYNNARDRLVPADNLLISARLNTTVDKIRSMAGPIGLVPLVNWPIIRLLTKNHFSACGDEICFPKEWSVIHGHFSADKFDALIPNPFRTVVLRDPLGRTISHYLYWQRARGVLNHFQKIPFDSNMSFGDFALQPVLQNFQTKALGGISLENFDVVGVTENLGVFIAGVARIRGGGFSQSLVIPCLNKALVVPDNNLLGIDDEFVRKFKSFNESDYSNYHKARKLCGLDAS